MKVSLGRTEALGAGGGVCCVRVGSHVFQTHLKTALEDQEAGVATLPINPSIVTSLGAVSVADSEKSHTRSSV